MKKLTATLIFGLLLSLSAPSQIKQAYTPIEPPADFKGDGCTAFPDGDYADCCLAHDKDYFRGGTAAERRASDDRLYQCVRAKGHKMIAPMMWLGVRALGFEFLGASFSWGFGQRAAKK